MQLISTPASILFLFSYDAVPLSSPSYFTVPQSAKYFISLRILIKSYVIIQLLHFFYNIVFCFFLINIVINPIFYHKRLNLSEFREISAFYFRSVYPVR